MEEALLGGVDVLQLRDRTLSDRELLSQARTLSLLAHEHDALFFVNDRIDIALLAEADGVHVGQEDIDPSELRGICGHDLLIGQSTHTRAQIAALRAVDYFCAGPVHETPTKPGRSSVGHELITHAASHGRLPWFATGGINSQTAPAIIAAGATRLVVVRAITQARKPRVAAEELRRLLGD